MLWLLRRSGEFLAVIAYALGVRRTVTIQNLARAFPEYSSGEVRRIARNSYQNLGRTFAEFVFLRFGGSGSILSGLELNNEREIATALGANEPVVLLSAHLGNWEWMAIVAGLKLPKPMSIVIKNQKDSRAERFLIRMRTRFGNKLIKAGSVREIHKELQRS